MQTAVAQVTPRPVLPGIQMLRGMAAVLVVAAHANLMMGHADTFGASPFPLRDAGTFGVAVFFIISGFIIVNVSLNTDWSPRLAIGDYAQRRFIRIVPFLWISVIAYNALSYVGTGKMEWMAALRAMTLWPIGELKPNVVWSLVHEMIFYTLFAIAMLRPRMRPGILVMWFIAPLVYGAVLAINGATVVSSPWLAELMRVVLLGGHSGANLQFGAGFLLGLLWLRWRAFSGFVMPFGLYVALAILLVAVAIIEIADFPIASFGRMIVWTLLALVTVAFGVMAREKKGVLYSVGMVLGDASFSIYLVHNMAVVILLEASKHVPWLMPLPLWCLFLTTAAIVAGVVVHYLVEKPLINRLAHGRALFPWQRRLIAAGTGR